MHLYPLLCTSQQSNSAKRITQQHTNFCLALKNLPKYLDHFGPPNNTIQIVAGPELCQCIGVNGVNKPHCVLKAEGSYSCSKCQNTFCSTCGYAPQKDRDRKKKKCKFSKSYFDNMDEPLCMECYKTQLFLPLGGDKTIMSTSEMIAVLKESNYQIGDETPANVVEEIYDIHLLGDTKHDELLKQIRFPKYWNRKQLRDVSIHKVAFVKQSFQ